MKFSNGHNEISGKVIYVLELTEEESNKKVLTERDKEDIKKFTKTGDKIRNCDYLFALALKVCRLEELEVIS